MKDQIFISHANPEDNEFAIWLASRLEMLGYQVWIDKNQLIGGERIWPTIQKAIDSSKKVFFVCSSNILRNGVLRDGMDREFEYAMDLAKSKGINEFVIPLHIDNSPYNSVIGLPNLNKISFDGNWADGIKQLKKKLDKDGVLYDENIASSFSNWYEDTYITDCQVEKRKEVYYSSWWSVKEMPQLFYMYQFANREQAKAICDANKDIPTALLSNIVSSFDNHLSYTIIRDEENIEVPPQHVFEYKITDILFGFESDRFPSHRDVENHFKDFIRMIICRILYKNGLKATEFSGKKKVFYYPKTGNKFHSIKFDYPKPTMSKPKKKSLGGRYKDKGSWHYGVSLNPILFPYIGVSVNSHLVFSSDGINIISNPSKQHAYRRNKGKNFFNEKWRDLLLAFIYSLRNDNGNIEITVTKNGEKLVMKHRPEWYWSDYGYKDPSTEMDIDSVENNNFETIDEEEENHD